MATNMPSLTETEELKVVSALMDELNSKFALRLDPKPSAARSGSEYFSSEEGSEQRFTIAIAGSSHATRLQDPLASTHLKVVDVSIPGFRISEAAVESMVTDLEVAVSGLADDTTVVLIQPFDNSIFFSGKARG